MVALVVEVVSTVSLDKWAVLGRELVYWRLVAVKPTRVLLIKQLLMLSCEIHLSVSTPPVRCASFPAIPGTNELVGRLTQGEGLLF